MNLYGRTEDVQLTSCIQKCNLAKVKLLCSTYGRINLCLKKNFFDNININVDRKKNPSCGGL